MNADPSGQIGLGPKAFDGFTNFPAALRTFKVAYAESCLPNSHSSAVHGATRPRGAGLAGWIVFHQALASAAIMSGNWRVMSVVRPSVNVRICNAPGVHAPQSNLVLNSGLVATRTTCPPDSSNVPGPRPRLWSRVRYVPSGP